MSIFEQRFLVYSALGILCGAASLVLGVTAAIWSFLQVVLVIEFINWIGTPGREQGRAAGK